MCTHLLCVPTWPLTTDGMDAIAYLSQFEIVSGPYELEHSYYSRHSVVVLRVPEWAAAHATELRAPLHSEPDDGESTQQSGCRARPVFRSSATSSDRPA